MIDPISLAAIAIGFLPRALPYLTKLGSAMGDSLTKEAGDKFGPEAWETAKSIWSKIGGKLMEKPAAKDAVSDVISNPEDKDNIASLRKEIRKVLEEDPSLAAELQKIVENRVKADITLQNVMNSVVQGVEIEGGPAVVDLTIKAGDVTNSRLTGVSIKKFP